MSLVQIDWHPRPADLRKFGLSMIVGFGLLGGAFFAGWPVEAHRALAVGLWIGGGAAGLAGLSGTAVALPFYWVWMSLAFVMGNIMSRVILTLFYYTFFTPFGIVMRLTGRDKLGLRKCDVDSYWSDVEQPSDKERYERQF